MPRRKTVHKTSIKGTGKVDYTVVWRVFECYRPGCDLFMKISEDLIQKEKAKGNPIRVTCPKCGYTIPEEIIERAPRWKYCRVCEWLQPLENFHKHKPTSTSFRSGRQLECKFCKNQRINRVLNPLRTSDQFRESSQHRRLYNVLSEEIGKINSKKIFEKFESKCFNCNKVLTYKTKGTREWALDHTLPARFFWPMTTDNATLLCNDCNNLKHDKWPSEIYSEDKLRKLAVLTGYPYSLLSGSPKINPKALQKILANVDKFIEDWIKYPDDIKKIRKLILEMAGIDIYEKAKHVPHFLRD
jgi:5-methylcytosine-specific restriction endonuclease McrA